MFQLTCGNGYGYGDDDDDDVDDVQLPKNRRAAHTLQLLKRHLLSLLLQLQLGLLLRLHLRLHLRLLLGLLLRLLHRLLLRLVLRHLLRALEMHSEVYSLISSLVKDLLGTGDGGGHRGGITHRATGGRQGHVPAPEAAGARHELQPEVHAGAGRDAEALGPHGVKLLPQVVHEVEGLEIDVEPPGYRQWRAPAGWASRLLTLDDYEAITSPDMILLNTFRVLLRTSTTLWRPHEDR